MAEVLPAAQEQAALPSSQADAAEHAGQAVVAVCAAYVPAWHASHGASPFLSLYVPVAQATQKDSMASHLAAHPRSSTLKSERKTTLRTIVGDRERIGFEKLYASGRLPQLFSGRVVLNWVRPLLVTGVLAMQLGDGASGDMLQHDMFKQKYTVTTSLWNSVSNSRNVKTIPE